MWERTNSVGSKPIRIERKMVGVSSGAVDAVEQEAPAALRVLAPPHLGDRHAHTDRSCRAIQATQVRQSGSNRGFRAHQKQATQDRLGRELVSLPDLRQWHARRHEMNRKIRDREPNERLEKFLRAAKLGLHHDATYAIGRHHDRAGLDPRLGRRVCGRLGLDRRAQEHEQQPQPRGHTPPDVRYRARRNIEAGLRHGMRALQRGNRLGRAIRDCLDVLLLGIDLHRTGLGHEVMPVGARHLLDRVGELLGRLLHEQVVLDVLVR